MVKFREKHPVFGEYHYDTESILYSHVTTTTFDDKGWTENRGIESQIKTLTEAVSAIAGILLEKNIITGDEFLKALTIQNAIEVVPEEEEA